MICSSCPYSPATSKRSSKTNKTNKHGRMHLLGREILNTKVSPVVPWYFMCCQSFKLCKIRKWESLRILECIAIWLWYCKRILKVHLSFNIYLTNHNKPIQVSFSCFLVSQDSSILAVMAWYSLPPSLSKSNISSFLLYNNSPAHLAIFIII